jgi:hypothetical protein
MRYLSVILKLTFSNYMVFNINSEVIYSVRSN